MGLLLNGRKLACTIGSRLTHQVESFVHRNGWAPHLALVLIEDDPASHVYVTHKMKACREVGFKVTLCKERAHLTEAALLALVRRLNEDPSIQGIVVQLPLPPHIDPWTIIQAINPMKDVDGLHPDNYGKMAYNHPAHIPATPLGILLLLAYYKIETVGKQCVIVGRGSTVGAPLSILLSRKGYPGNATVTVCHSQTKDLAFFTSQADVLVVAVGKPYLVTADMVKAGATVIDVGLSRLPDCTKKSGYRLQGDVDFESVYPRCSYITPVPGGVGPMTVMALLLNTLRAASQSVYTDRGLLDEIIREDLPPRV